MLYNVSCRPYYPSTLNFAANTRFYILTPGFWTHFMGRLSYTLSHPARLGLPSDSSDSCPCRQDHHHVHSSHGWGRPPWGPHRHNFPGEALLRGHPTLLEELLWHRLLLNLGAQNEKHPEPENRLWGMCLPKGRARSGCAGMHAWFFLSRHFYPDQALAGKIDLCVPGIKCRFW